VIALDTNVLVRFLVADDEGQHEAARRSLERLGPAEQAGFVSDIVLVELVWVLRAGYGFSRREIMVALEALASADHLSFEDDERISRALRAFAEGRGDFADYLIRERADAAGCTTVETFDRVLHAEKGFSPPG
jgi:predicted nucleic-acid-binding protein